MRMIIQLRGVLIHDLLRHRDRVLPFRLRHLLLICLQSLMLDLLLGMLLKQLHDFAVTCGMLVDAQCRGKLAVGSELDFIEKINGEVLTVVRDEVVLNSVRGGKCRRSSKNLLLDASLASDVSSFARLFVRLGR